MAEDRRADRPCDKADGRTGYCVACLRTRDDARGWTKMTDHRRHQIVIDRARRQAMLPQATTD
ncbi:DUF1289 domain-containing protein [Burkholderia anthina]|uniref:DUF1289 domain-containing protein n=1 Tax=Burkholderia anthina TaxID=179879 RepID=UPI00158CE102|nr:DUF1289 domain-containing protein [Burkholderia anthina]